jgi:hypothetical protein
MSQKFPSKDEQDRIRIELGAIIASVFKPSESAMGKMVLGLITAAYWLGYSRGRGLAGAEEARAKIAKRKAKRAAS